MKKLGLIGGIGPESTIPYYHGIVYGVQKLIGEKFFPNLTATIKGISSIAELQKKYHVASIREEDKSEGFVTTLFSEEQFKELIETENGITIACDGNKIVSYVMAASWEYWAKWPLFQHMINDLQNTEYMGRTLSTKNSYQYGPICIDKDYRGSEVLFKVFDFSRVQMNKRYPILITFINHINPRSYYAHTKKLGLDVIKSFEFNNNTYYDWVMIQQKDVIQTLKIIHYEAQRNKQFAN